jgi:hypothetical protein
VEARFIPFGDIASVGATVVRNLISIRLETVLVSVQDRCTVCSKQAIGKLFRTHPMELLGDVGHVKSHFGLFRDSVSVSAR